MIRQKITTSLKAAKQRTKLVQPRQPNLLKTITNSLKRYHKSPQLKWFLIGFAVVCLFFLSIIVFKANDIFAIQKVHCYIGEQPCPQSYQNLLGNVNGSNLIDFDANQFQTNLINLNPMVKAITVKKKLPHTIQFTFTLRIPLAVIIDKNSRTFFIDDTGKIFAQNDHPDVTHIFIDEAIAVGETAASPKLTGSLQIIQAMEDSFIPVKTIDTKDGSNFEVVLHTGQVIQMSNEKDKLKQVDALQLILQNSKIVSPDIPIKTIDLRYDSPIVR